MSYTKTQWVNDTTPAINANNLNKIEQGIYDAHQDVLGKVSKSGDTMSGNLNVANGKVHLGELFGAGNIEVLDSNGNQMFNVQEAGDLDVLSLGSGDAERDTMLVLYNSDGGQYSVSPTADDEGYYELKLPSKNGTLAVTSDIEVTPEDIQSSKTLKSSVVTVNDAAPINAEDITVDITPKQDLHGYDRPWAGGAGKNKLPVMDSDETVSGVTYTKLLDNDSNVTGIKCVGTISGANAKYLSTNVTLPAGTYILTGGSGISSTGIRLIAVYNESGTEYYRNAIREQGITFTLNAETQVAFYLRGEQTNLAVNTIIYPMIRLATETDPTFAPYSNECPIEGRTGAELDRVGKNWLNYDDNTSGYNNQRCSSSIINNEIIINATGTDCYIGQLNTAYSDAYFAISPCIEGDVLKLVVSNNLFAKNYVTFFNKNNEIVGALYIYLNNFTVPKGAVKMGFRIGNELSVSGTTYRLKAMVVKATETDATYEPYQGQQYTASLGETVYGGKWHVTEGGTDKTYGNIANYNGETINEPWLSSMDEYSPGATPTTGAQVVYPLTTPTTISTPKQNVPMLQGINTVYADCGDTSLKYQPDNVIGELKGMIQALDARVTALEEAE